MSFRNLRALALGLAVIAAPVLARAQALPDQASILAAMEKMTAAEIAVLQRPTPLPTPGPEVHVMNSNWVNAIFYIGASRYARVAQEQRTIAFLRNNVAERYNYSLRGATSDTRGLLNADDQAIGDLYLELYERRPAEGMILPLKARMDYILPYLTKTPAHERLVWWWCDAMFMAPPVLTRLSAITGDAKYIDAMDVAWWRTYDRLWDKEEHLYARDERFLTMRSPNGKKIFWGRGNGWVMAGLARVLEFMPADYPSRPRYEALFKEMSARIITLQQPDGLWRTSLLDLEAFPGPETSGTAFYTYALAFGINHGLLDRATYQPHVISAWNGLNRHILPSGLLGSVQRTGDQPVPTEETDTGLYANGGFLLAGTEMLKLGQPVTALPAAPAPLDRGFGGGAGQGQGAPRPAGQGQAQAPVANPNQPAVPEPPRTDAERARRAAEQTAVRALAYTPSRDDPDYKAPTARPR
jgi:rhamnogalacturonyl hydrolase YesR